MNRWLERQNLGKEPPVFDGLRGLCQRDAGSYLLRMSLKKKKTKALEDEIERIFLIFLVLVVGVVLLIAVLFAALGRK
jgi:hypothetical protein